MCIRDRYSCGERNEYFVRKQTGSEQEAVEKLYRMAKYEYESCLLYTSGQIMMEVPPWFYMRLKQAYTARDTDNSKMLENGRVGKYGNVIVKMSNNVAVDSSANSTFRCPECAR